MEYLVTLDIVAEIPVAAARQRTTFKLIAQDIGPLLGLPWAFLSEHPELRNDSFNVAIYLDDTGGGIIEVGVQVKGWFEETDGVVNSSTPSGTVATTAHYGPYGDLGAAHKAVRAWRREQGNEIVMPFWEVYGHWNDDWSKVRTNSFYLIR